MPTFNVTPVDQADADSIRREIASGHRTARLVTLDEPGAPCRSCLQPAETGEQMWLLSYQPFRGESLYAAPSPIFLHAKRCAPYDQPNQLPDLVLTGERAVRSYDDRHELVDGAVGAGADVEALIDKLLADDRAAYLHIYSATAGCYTCRVDRQ